MPSEHDARRQRSGAFYGARTGGRVDIRAETIRHNQALRDLLSDCIDKTEFTLLDIGCGRGLVARIVKDSFPNAQIFGIDISAEQIEKARVFVPEGTFSVSNEINMSFIDNTFDYATCRMSIHHYPDMLRHLREVNRVLRLGGAYLIIDSVPVSGEQDVWLNEIFLAREREGIGDGHLKFYTAEEYAQFFDMTGFVLERLMPLPHTIVMPKADEAQASVYRHLLRAPESFRNSIGFLDEEQLYRYDLPTHVILARKHEGE